MDKKGMEAIIRETIIRCVVDRLNNYDKEYQVPPEGLEKVFTAMDMLNITLRPYIIVKTDQIMVAIERMLNNGVSND